MKYPVTAQRLREALNNKNMKAQELADKTGINKASISQYINGSHAPSNISAGKMADVLNVSPLWLMGFDISLENSGNNDYTEKALEMYSKYEKADPNIKAAIENLLKGTR